MLTVLFAGGVLFVKYQLQSLRGTVQARVEEKLGGRLQVGAFRVNGLRGFRVDNFEARLVTPVGPIIEIAIPSICVNLDLIDLLYGEVTIERLQLDDARVMVTRPDNGPWFKAREKPAEEIDLEALRKIGLRVTGVRCAVDIRNVVETTNLRFTDLAFDISHMAGASDLTGNLSGLVNDVPEKRLKVDIRLAGPDDFDFRMQSGAIRAEDINAFLPEEQRVLQQGAVEPSIRLAGYPNRTLVLSVEAPFRELHFRGQPEFFAPATGKIAALASYGLDDKLLTLATAQVSGNELSGRLDGTVSLQGPQPVFDLHLQADQAPFKEAFDYFLKGKSDEYGKLNIELTEPYQVGAGLQGTPDAPVFSAEASVGAGRVTFAPKDPRIPKADLKFGLMKISWESGNPMPYGSFNITEGTIDQEEVGLHARNISGTLILKEKSVTLDPVSAELTGNAFVGRASYDLEAQKGVFSVTGALREAEKTPLGEIDDLAVAGTVNAHCEGELSKERLYFVSDLDLTQAQVDFDWWLRKPVGVGATIKGLAVEVLPNKRLTIHGDGAIDATQLHADFDFNWVNKKWMSQVITFTLNPIDAATATKCLRVPYLASGGVSKNFIIEWKRKNNLPKDNTVHVAGDFDEASFLADGTTIPAHGKKLHVDVMVDLSATKERGVVTINAGDAEIPPLGVRWILPLRAKNPPLPEGQRKKKKDDDDGPANREATWVFNLTADKMFMPPWRGTNFKGVAFDEAKTSGLRSFSADMDGGTIDGNFRVESVDNVMEMNAKWNKIPASYLCQHLKFPDLLEGTASGQVHYVEDNDDPSTLKGAGLFEITNGHFSADFLAKQLKDQLKGDNAILPPSLEFSEFSADVELNGDMVAPKNILLKGAGITITGDGQYVSDGDMQFKLKASITPETARRMPILLKSFNINGHKLTRNNIELAFDISGPTFHPSSAVTGLPSVGVTLVSGAGEVANEAIKVIDAPRQILLDLIKIFGGIVGPGNKPQAVQ